MRKLIIVMLLFQVLNSANSLKAQNVFKPGFIITIEGDTIHGSIVANSQGNFKTCTFKKKGTEDIVHYTPAQLRAYQFDDGKFLISKSLIINEVDDRYFIEYLFKGKVNVYFFYDGTEHYFVEKENEKLVELTETEKTVRSKEGKNYLQPKLYKGKLKAIMADCFEVHKSIDNDVTLNHQSLIKIAQNYHNIVCKNEQCVIYTKQINPLKIKFAPFVGRDFTLMLSGENIAFDIAAYTTVGVKVSTVNLLAYSESLNFEIAPSFQYINKVNLIALGYDAFYYEGKYIIIAPKGHYSNHRPTFAMNLNMGLLKFPISFIYSPFDWKVQPYIGGGYITSFALFRNKTFILYPYNKEKFPISYTGFVGKIGINIKLRKTKKLFIEGGYEQLSSIKDILRFFNYTIKAGYRF